MEIIFFYLMEKEDLKFSVNNYLNMIYNNIKIEKNQQEKKLINEKAYRSSQLFTTSLFEEIIGKEKEKNGKLRNELIELKYNLIYLGRIQTISSMGYLKSL